MRTEKMIHMSERLNRLYCRKSELESASLALKMRANCSLELSSSRGVFSAEINNSHAIRAVDETLFEVNAEIKAILSVLNEEAAD